MLALYIEYSLSVCFSLCLFDYISKWLPERELRDFRLFFTSLRWYDTLDLASGTLSVNIDRDRKCYPLAAEVGWSVLWTPVYMSHDCVICTFSVLLGGYEFRTKEHCPSNKAATTWCSLSIYSCFHGLTDWTDMIKQRKLLRLNVKLCFVCICLQPTNNHLYTPTFIRGKTQ